MSTSYKANAIAKEKLRAAERTEASSGFAFRNYWIYVLVAFLVLPACTLLSVFTEGFNYYATWAEPMGFFRIPAATLLAVTINALVIMLGKGIVDDVQDGVFSSKLYDKAMFVLKTLAFMGCLYWSVANSLAGAPHLRTYIKESKEPVAMLLTDPNQVDAAYADRRKQQLEIIASARRTTWKGNITAAAMKTLRAAQGELSKIDAAIVDERQQVAAGNDATTNEYNTELAASAEASVTIAGIGQLGQIFCVLIIGLWYKGVQDEDEDGAAAGAMKAAAAVAGSPRGIGFHPAAAAHHPTSGPSADPTAINEERNPIGFRLYEAPAAPAVATGSYNDETEDGFPMDAISRLNSYRAYKKEEGIYASRNTSAAREALEGVRAGLAFEQEQLAQLGLRVELEEHPRKRYILVPV